MNVFFYFLITFLVGVVIAPPLIKFSQKTHFLVDAPEGDALKIHKNKIPLLGGLAITISVIVGFLFVLKEVGIIQVGAVVVGFLVLFSLGFYDDLKWKHVSNIKPKLKFVLLIACALVPSIILYFTGIHFNFIPVAIISIPLGFVYIFVSINAINYQDGMDGLAGGLVSISLAGFLYLGTVTNVPLAAAISLIVLGAVAAFLQFNYPPAKMFMGDSGAYSLGFILTVLAMLFSKPLNIYSVLGPMLIIGLPIFDGVFTNIRRLVSGKSIFLGDRSHFYDKLLQRGLSSRKTLTVCYFLQSGLVLMGIFIYGK